MAVSVMTVRFEGSSRVTIDEEGLIGGSSCSLLLPPGITAVEVSTITTTDDSFLNSLV